ncbi:uncharacterized protein [Blastocystis hominis]|uniref:Uncharacterized protein n=1 Tax=Blastocystis hominis TaxID=12968 RepID=D8MAQ9_BLAHO|nr:uncharacterized protein [Blastocystis hominis]CBK25148.2 unnamed protein product [Blastocystis hominis]|eukprot:XP_012899196.1 uncharacterized protein [Blastocystis hominis]
MFGFDMPHLPGSYREEYIKTKVSKNYYMYSAYRKRLRIIAKNYTVLPICQKNKILPVQAIY